MKLLDSLDRWLDENQIKNYVTEASFRWFLIVMTGVVAHLIDWSTTRAVSAMFVVYLILYPMTAKRLAQLIILLSVTLAASLIIHRYDLAADIALAIYFLFFFVVARLIWDSGRTKLRR